MAGPLSVHAEQMSQEMHLVSEIKKKVFYIYCKTYSSCAKVIQFI